MSFLNPWLLLAAAALAVPVVLHLFHRHESRRLSFPALRYLLRTERDHTRRIRLRQLLLLLMRAAAILLIVLAGARPFLRRGDGTHPPTALAIVLDNSLSSGRVVGDERVLDGLERRSLAALELAGEEDRIWVVRAGEPWDVATPADAATARDRVAATEVSAAAADLTEAVRRAAGLVRQAGLPAAEVHVLTDLQRTALPSAGAPDQGVPVLVFHTPGPQPTNRYLGSVLVGGGLPPVAGRRTELVVGVAGDGAGAGDLIRLIVDGQIRGATRAPVGASVVLPFGPHPAGWVEGYVETDPDQLGGDDRRWFALSVRPPPVVALRGDAPFFLEQALAVLEDGGRLRRSATRPDVVVAVAGEGAAEARAGGTVVIVPPGDPELLPALNRRLSEADIPWRYQPLPGVGERRVGEHRLPLPLDDLRVASAYRLAGSEASPAAEVLARLDDGSPWLVQGTSSSGAYRLVASAFDPSATNLPVSAFMVPLLEWLISTSPRGSGARALEAGASLPLPAAATAVKTPDGVRHPVDASQEFRETRAAGIYRVLAGDSVVDLVAVNPPVRESLLEPADMAAVALALGVDLRVLSDSTAWAQAVFTSRRGEELWRPLLVVALLLLIAESLAAASGARRASPGTPARPRTRDDPSPPATLPG